MKKKSLLKKIGWVFIFLLVAIQFVRINKENPTFDSANDLLVMSNPSAEIKELMKSACYDCHSNETTYPWYSNVAPVSWWLEHHVEEGREHLNFSEWGTYSVKKANHKLDECAEEVEEGEMPLDSYTWTHADAELSQEQRHNLEVWFKSLMTEE